ncbi:unnamed protein product [Parascedosporium putredinis]|uniref:UspA domain-containing protein n=1 Tax=Parascedosporium putredinis TaxID=1442378 RepID=A0A9P1HDS1_9PEZI|nr:unnamed protein product [Parascedosporium putredinis]CAI8004597.1 unnamed protein product [Parascedosporium putredinis]
MSHHAMSLEAAMDEERLAILEILERQAAAKVAPQTSRRSASPMTTPRSPIRSLLDVETSPARKGTPPPLKPADERGYAQIVRCDQETHLAAARVTFRISVWRYYHLPDRAVVAAAQEESAGWTESRQPLAQVSTPNPHLAQGHEPLRHSIGGPCHAAETSRGVQELVRRGAARLGRPARAFGTTKVSQQEDGEGPLVKAYLGPDGERLDDSSSDDEPHTDADDEDENHRGRNTAPRIVYGSESAHRDSMSSDQGKQLSSAYKQGEVNPSSTVNSANNSENEIERDEIRTAQEMSVRLTDVFSTPETNRSVRVIYRGEFTKVVAAAVEEHKKLRKYLVATDLSDHSAHALEWAVGTVLRDGDTLVATCCLSEEGDGNPNGNNGSSGNGSNGADEGKDASALNPPPTQHRASSISLLTSAFANRDSGVYGPNSGNNGAGDSASNISTGSAKEQDRLEAERQQVIEEVTAKVSKLLRRTKLQMIDLIKPTLVILGSRGRSSIKGVILGSFSNYLVTKSSVPVMVARKRLRKKTRRGPMKQVNNLSNPAGRSLASAKID